MLDRFLQTEFFGFLLVFVRLGTAMLVMPGLGSNVVPVRGRLAFALLLTLIVTPLVERVLPAEPATVAGLARLMFGEFVIGAFIGTLTAIVASILENAGAIIGFQTGFASAVAFNPMVQAQSSVIGSFLTLTGGVILFASGLHELLIRAIVDSYAVFQPGVPPIAEDMALTVARLVADSFRIGFQLSAPFFLVALALYLAMGLLSRLMPQLQIFFLALPLQLFLGVLTLGLTISAIMLWYVESFTGYIEAYLRPV